jgi:Ring finger domain
MWDDRRLEHSGDDAGRGLPLNASNPMEWCDIMEDIRDLFPDSEDDTMVAMNLEKVFDDVANEETCPICFETLFTNSNYTITKCGHKFCTQCICKHVSLQNHSCPFCRDNLYHVPQQDTSFDSTLDGERIQYNFRYNLSDEEDDDDEEEGYDEEEDDDYEEGDEISENAESAYSEESETMCSIEVIAEKAQSELKLSYNELLMMLLFRFDKDKYTRDKMEEMEDKLFSTVHELDDQVSNEHEERLNMLAEDIRV